MLRTWYWSYSSPQQDIKIILTDAHETVRGREYGRKYIGIYSNTYLYTTPSALHPITLEPETPALAM